MNSKDLFIAAKSASRNVATLSDEIRARALMDVAEAIETNIEMLLAANVEDLSALSEDNPLYDRLKLTPDRLHGIASDMRKVAKLPSPLGRTLESRVLPNGLRLRKVSVPFGVIGVIYEARPNVTFDVFSLCLRSGNACVLKGGRDADRSNRAAVALIREVLAKEGIDPAAVTLLPPSHEAASELLGAVGYIDLVIPRGGRRLIDFVRDNAKVPCIETGAGIVHTYFDAEGDLEIGRKVVTNAKMRRVSVCNALDCLIVHSSRLSGLPGLLQDMNGVCVHADERSFGALRGRFTAGTLVPASDADFGTEWLSYNLSVKTVDSLDEALEHISRHGSGHSEAIVSSDPASIARFQAEVDAACVYVNAPTSFTDGAQFGLGAEIGISTQKLGARGPMGLCEITTYKYLVEGEGQTRP